jgi:SSS family solute:Na+ symporter
VGVLAGIVAGYLSLLLPTADAGWANALPGWDRGLVAMAVNAAVAVGICLAVPRRAPIPAS